MIADAMRAAYGAQFALTSAGGIRASLSCLGILSDCPATPPPYAITRRNVFALLPFGNRITTLSVNGAELKSMLEHGVADDQTQLFGRFPQVSGLCFTYNPVAMSGSRVVGAVRQASNGSCTGAAIDPTSASNYTIALNGFTIAGGDGYPDFRARATRHGILDRVVASYVAANSAISPAIQGRIATVSPLRCGDTCMAATR